LQNICNNAEIEQPEGRLLTYCIISFFLNHPHPCPLPSRERGLQKGTFLSRERGLQKGTLLSRRGKWVRKEASPSLDGVGEGVKI
jgi:hypothetical protein